MTTSTKLICKLKSRLTGLEPEILYELNCLSEGFESFRAEGCSVGGALSSDHCLIGVFSSYFFLLFTQGKCIV